MAAIHFPPSSSTDVYGSFSSAEQAEYDLMRDAWFGAGFDPVGSPEFSTFGMPLPLEKSRMKGILGCEGFGQQDDIFSTPVFGQYGLDSRFNVSSPCSPSRFQTPSTISPRDIHLGIPGSGDYSPMPYLSPFSSPFDLSSSFSYSKALSPVITDKGNESYSIGKNALGLFGNPLPHDGANQSSSSPLLFPYLPLSNGAGEQFAPTPSLTFNDRSLLSPIIDATAQRFIGTGLPSPIEDCVDLNHTTLPTLPSACAARSEPDFPIDASSPGLFAHTPELMYPSPSPTPERPAVPLPSRSKRKSKASRARPVRAAAARRKSYRESSASPESPSSAISETSSSEGKSSDDECEYGTRVWVSDKRGRRVAKWKCRFCGTITGRRPDLHRHYKTCVTREKYFCVDVVHADGDIWRGCGMMFSRRDACHRHLKRRFTEGRCSRTKPKLSHCACEDEYETKLAVYYEMLDNAKRRAELPAAEKNRLVKTALSHIKQDMF